MGLANEVACLREENLRVVGECTRLMAENNQLAQDHAQLLEHSRKMTEELKTKNLELIKLKVNVKKHLEEVIKDREAYLAKNLELEKDRDL